MVLDPSTVVRIREQLVPLGVEARNISKTLFVHTPATTTDVNELIRDGQVRSYVNLDQVAEDWGTNSAPYEAAIIYFQQSPGPLAVASYFTAARSGIITGASTSATQTAIRALGATAPFTFLGASGTADLSSVTTPATVATALATGINAISGVTGVTVSATGSAFTSPHSYTVNIPSALASASSLDFTSGMTGSTADLLGLSSTAVYARPFTADTTIKDALDRINSVDSTWHMIALAPATEATTSNVENAAEWAEATNHILGFNSTENVALNSTDTTSLFAKLTAASRSRSFGVYSKVNDHKALSAMGRLSAVNYDGVDSTIILAHKVLPGVQPDDITQSQSDILDAKNANIYTTLAGRPRFLFGRSFTGFIDQRIWLDWLIDRLQTQVMNLLSSSNKIPMSSRGLSQIQAVVRGVCEQGRANGGFTPGTLDQAVIGSVRQVTENPDFNGYLPNGYLVHVSPLSAADTENRVAPPIHIWGIYFGGINKINIDLILGG